MNRQVAGRLGLFACVGLAVAAAAWAGCRDPLADVGWLVNAAAGHRAAPDAGASKEQPASRRVLERAPGFVGPPSPRPVELIFGPDL